MMKKTNPCLCIYCGSSIGKDPIWSKSSRLLSEMLSARAYDLIYGGASIGIMGEVADAFLRGGSRVTGVIPETLASREIAHEGLDELIITMSMHERKATMADRADAFIALPGGYGTFEELLEVITWNQIRIMDKPVILFNVNRYFEPLIAMFAKAEEEGFVRTHPKPYYFIAENEQDVLDILEAQLP
jgi:uncharacterized protein (TIGR00730 family)